MRHFIFRKVWEKIIPKAFKQKINGIFQKNIRKKKIKILPGGNFME